MIFHEIDIRRILATNLLGIESKSHKRDWDFYSEQYVTAFFTLLDTGREERKCSNTSILNAKFMAFLFLMRHSLELLMKKQIVQSSPEMLKGHNLKDLATVLGVDVQDFLSDFALLLPESEGDCFRYTTDNNGVRFFSVPDGIFYFETCNHFISYYNQLKNKNVDYLPDDRLHRGYFTFYPREVIYNGVVASHYDEAIYDLLMAIENKQITAQQIYLPLLFLIRHSLELKLKQAVESIGDAVDANDKDKIWKEHSVSKIFKMLNKYINKAIDLIPADDGLLQESLLYKKKAHDFQQQINKLDSNSYILRFPVDRKGGLSNYMPSKSDLSDALRLYVEADTFLVFAVEVLAKNGYLKLGDDIMHELMGC